MSEITDSDGSTDGTATPGAVHEFYDADGDDPLGYTVVATAAAARGTDPVDLPPLYDSIDADALSALVDGAVDRPDAVDGRVTFSYAGYEVTVDFDGWIRLDPGSDTAAPR
jgi:hypothetical protein